MQTKITISTNLTEIIDGSTGFQNLVEPFSMLEVPSNRRRV